MVVVVQRMRRRRDDDGFTLIELLVVIIIIGILAGIAVPVFLNQRHKAYDASAKSDLRQLALQEETYMVDHGTYGTGSALHAAGLDVTPSNGDAVFVYYSSAQGYCLGSTNQQGTPSQVFAGWGVVYWYDNGAGGLEPEAAGCPTLISSGGVGWTAGTVIWANDWFGYNGVIGA